jgi:hypothetical protein
LVENYLVTHGELSREAVHRVEIAEIIVDDGQAMLVLPSRYVKQLGDLFSSTRTWRTQKDQQPLQVVGVVRLTVLGRECHVDAIEVSDDTPAVLGNIPLTLLDFVIDWDEQQLIGNPAHGGEQMWELY